MQQGKLAIASKDAEAVARALMRLFRGRRDDFVRAGSGPDDKWRGRAGAPLTDLHVENHVRGKYSVGPYILSPDIMEGRGCRFGCVDVDRDGAPGRAGAELVYEMLRLLDLHPRVELSKSARWHVWVFFDAQVPAASRGVVLPL